MRLGIFGGSFNPIHLGHLLLAETAREELRLDRLVFMPVGLPPHKPSRGLLPGLTRLKLVQLAIRDQPAFVASDLEVQRNGPSYTIETVTLLRQQVADAELFLLIGEDMLGVEWVKWNQIKRLCTVVVAHRAGRKPSGQERGLVWLAMPRVDISSSEIRKRVASGRSIRYRVPDAVGRHIRRHHLYASR